MNNTKFYTNALRYGDYILYRGVDDSGNRVKGKIKYQPKLYIKSSLVDKNKIPPTKYTDMHGDPLYEIPFESMKEAKEFAKKYEETEIDVYGNQSYEYNFLRETFPGEIAWDRDKISVANFDLEWGFNSAGSFADTDKADGPILTITIKMNNVFHIFGCKPYKVSQENCRYIKCDNEYDLLEKFILLWKSDYPDVMTGWWTNFADIPYLINRITRLFGEEKAKELSPWGIIKKNSTTLMGKEHNTYLIGGIGSLDYLELYRKFSPKGQSQESYKLDNICNVELGEKKISYKEYDNLQNLYEKDFQKFMDYNLRDVQLVDMMDQKLKLLDLAYTLAYNAKCNLDDIFLQTRMWDTLLSNFLFDENVIIPPKKFTEKEAFEGAYVKEPVVGKHEWVATLDLTSLYPSLIQQYGISPENIIEPKDYTNEMRDFLNQNLSVDNLVDKKVDTSFLKKNNITYTPNGQFFKNEKETFFARIITKMFNERQRYKKLMLEAEKNLEKIKKEIKKRKADNLPLDEILALEHQTKNDISKYNNLQLALKVSLNSLYGALGAMGFRYFDRRLAAAVTYSGQLSIKWIIKRINSYMNELLSTEEKEYVVFGDTDSNGIVFSGLVDKVFKLQEGVDNRPTTTKIVSFLEMAIKNKVQPYIDSCYQDLATYMNAHDQKMIMKLEKICNSAILVAKKRYIWSVCYNEGVVFDPPKLSVTGLDVVRSAIPDSVKKKLKDAVNLIVNGSKNDIIKFKNTFYKEFLSLPPEEIAVATGMQGLVEYTTTQNGALYKKGTPIHVRSAVIYNKLLDDMKLNKKYQKIHEGEKIRYIYLKLPNPCKENVVGFINVLPQEFQLHSYVDYAMMFQRTFINPIEIILAALGWNFKEENSLEDFFS